MVRRYGRGARWFHAVVYVTVLVLLGTGLWLLAGLEGVPSPLARLVRAPDTVLHTWVGWAYAALALVPLIVFGPRTVRRFFAESLRFRRADLGWLRAWPGALLSGRFGWHAGRFDPGQRLLNLGFVVCLLALAVSGAVMAGLHGGPAFAVAVLVHKWATYALIPMVAGHVLVAAGLLPGYRGVWRSMHVGGRLPRPVAERLWPAWVRDRSSGDPPEGPESNAKSP
ncbi:MAG: cytochrome b/b6 domain-containing protein [Streptosporangiales bacterium]|nr:cytochrome b/b6 domain-containing protein [Streptosporangiales bacterium]